MDPQGKAFLVAAQNTDGGWGYALGHTSAVEPTAAALLAMKEGSAEAEARQRAVIWLRNAQHADGGWGFSHGDAESAWQTAWAVLALARAREAGDVSNLGAKWLLNVKTAQFDDETIKTAKQLLLVDLSLCGWPWLPGEATFIEPTALAMLALESIDSKLSAYARLDEAVRYIQDRRCPGGGWNVGSPIQFDSTLPARAHPTAWVLMALSRLAPNTIHPKDLRVLRSEMHRDGGALALASGLLALRTLGEGDALAQVRLADLQGLDEGWAHNPYQAAIAIMAVRGYL